MNNSSATLMVAAFDHAVCIKISGRANFTSSLDLKKLVNELGERGYTRFVFDLSECMTMDSTFLGVLSGIGLKFFDAKTNATTHPLDLLNPNPRIAETLENLGVLHLFNICTEPEPLARNFQPLAHDDSASRADVTRTCLEAHQTLMGINPDNVRKFKDVAQFLAEDLKRLEMAEKK